MRLVVADNKKSQKKFLKFRKDLYKKSSLYIDNNYFMILEIFSGKLKSVQKMEITPVYVEDENSGSILCEGVIIYAKDLPEYIQLCFFEAMEGQQEAVQKLVDAAISKGKNHECTKLVIGLCGHVDYGLGLQDSRYDETNSFSAPGNPKFYNDYFRSMNCDEIKLNSYEINTLDTRLSRYQALINKLERKYTLRYFDKKNFERDVEIYTDLNNECFSDHKYYFHRDYEDDRELLEELFLFMKEDSLIFAFDGDKPVAFFMWYPDYNELAKPGEIFGVKHFFRNLVSGKNIRTAKVMEYGVLEEYRGVGLPLALMHKFYTTLDNYNCDRIISSWILDENKDSDSFVKGISDNFHTSFVVYELTI